jgi:hypothetical protein
MEYNPYAFKHGSNGLVPDNVRYSPYAFKPGRTGLIADGGCCYPCYEYAGIDEARGMDSAVRRFERAVDTLTKSLDSHEHCDRPRYTKQHIKSRYISTQGHDPKAIVREYLRQRCPRSFAITRLLCIDGETVSFDIKLRECNVVVKYWNPQKMQMVKQNNDFRAKALNRYMCSWANLQEQYEQNGNSIIHVATCDYRNVLDTLTCILEMADS